MLALTAASNEPILKADNLIAIFKRKMSVVSRKHLGKTHRLGSGSHLPLLHSNWFKDPALFKSFGLAVRMKNACSRLRNRLEAVIAEGYFFE